MYTISVLITLMMLVVIIPIITINQSKSQKSTAAMEDHQKSHTPQTPPFSFPLCSLFSFYSFPSSFLYLPLFCALPCRTTRRTSSCSSSHWAEVFWDDKISGLLQIGRSWWPQYWYQYQFAGASWIKAARQSVIYLLDPEDQVLSFWGLVKKGESVGSVLKCV